MEKNSKPKPEPATKSGELTPEKKLESADERKPHLAADQEDGQRDP